MTEKENKSVKLQFLVDLTMVEFMDEIQHLTSASSRAEVFRRALSVYGQLVRKSRDGAKIQIVQGKKRWELLPEFV